jgi:hypothetical protein
LQIFRVAFCNFAYLSDSAQQENMLLLLLFYDNSIF